MKYRCKHCLWFTYDRLQGGRCNAPVPQWVPTYFRHEALGVENDYANDCPLFKPRADVVEEEG